MNTPRVRFAPSPTGFMHLGNVRAALVNFLYARQKGGVFIVRIEDTDAQRNFDVNGKQILEDLAWLGLTYEEGPGKDGECGPYYQSERAAIYQSYLGQLEKIQRIYRCFCTVEELEKKRDRQLALKMPPRYDRTCLRLTEQEVASKLAQNLPFIWRFKLSDSSIEITDLARGIIHFDLKNFSDPAITRQDGSFTFIFANCVDDITMRITHVFRGEDHVSNTAQQADMYQAYGASIPVFWHLPIICTVEGKKLSKRDFGFSLNDLRDAGFLPEAITNYLAIIGGSFEHEIMSLAELAQAMHFDGMHASGQIKYDVEKLKWVNHKWLVRLPAHDLARQILVPVVEAYKVPDLSIEKLAHLISTIQSELITLNDIVPALKFYFERSHVDASLLITYNFEKYTQFFTQLLEHHTQIFEIPEGISQRISALAREHGHAPKEIFALVRIALIGSPQGAALSDIVKLLGAHESIARVKLLSHI